MYSLTYVSSAVTPFTSAQLSALCAQCVERNARNDVTGMLLYKDGSFMQVLEGEELAVRRVHAGIQRDRRHHGLITLLQEPIPARQFPQWSMGFKDLESFELPALPGYNPFLKTCLTADEFGSHPSRAQQLLRTFKQYM